ncbi:DUF3987 domain-containing protein [Rhodomicrobium sp. Az07]|uniref:DUF3987 domain-containing protein n=1 Tax=Rhodomicrobium sp. Az07 TaxID=2839034 RepID=UPI001BE98A07|nr:DUF3987 domain-containing protein [Rhodomicrobium sp. Az07]MBT3071900.1 DUF3987 domain-containing protein [Rhodomicrobium sp. Az07]
MEDVKENTVVPQANILTDQRAKIPQELKNLPQWALAGADKRPLKVDGSNASSTDRATWTTFESACSAAAERGWNIGFMLNAEDPFTCIDLDVKDKDTHPDEPRLWTPPEQSNRFQKIITSFNSYTERSRSGKGFHIWVRGSIGRGRKRDGVEVYSQDRFIICTGDVYSEKPIEDRETLLGILVREINNGKEPALIELADGGVPNLALASNLNEDKGDIGKLWRGGWQDMGYPSQSEADLALVKRLMTECNSSEDCWATFLLSELGKRDKAKRPDYARRTISVAIQHLENDAAQIQHGRQMLEVGFMCKDTLIKIIHGRTKMFKVDSENDNDKAFAVPAACAFHDRTPLNFLATPSAPALDPAHLPSPIAYFANAYADANGFDRSGVIMAAISAAAAMLDDSYTLEAKPGWRLSPRLWTVLIGKSATGKSPTIKAATEPVKLKHSEVVKCFQATYKPDPDRPDARPPEPALYSSDATIEALSEKLRHNPRGLLMLTEEFSSWIGAIDSSGRGEAAKNRGAWLQLYDGGPYQIDRIGRKSYQVPNWGASVLTATTPSALAEHLKHLPEDGLIQRFIPVIVAPRDFDKDGDACAAQDHWKKYLDYLFRNSRTTIQFSPEARRLFKESETELGKMATAMDDVSSALASHIGKHSEMIARIALVFHAFEEKPSTTLSAETLQKAINLMRQVRKHSVVLFTDILARSPATEVARALARSLAAADPATQTIGRDWMTQHCRAFEKAKDDRTRREAVQLLEDLDWLRDASSRTYGGWPTKWEVNQNIFRLYAQEGEAHRAKRAAVQEVFGEQARA